jgi:soluble lytic murein transglycosylase-like protein
MSALTIGNALAIALACGPKVGPAQPSVSPDVLISVAYTESGLDPLAIHDNATGAVLHPGTRGDAIALADQLIASSHRPDLGLMQINSPVNLKRTGLTVETAFDPCASIRAGAQLLLDDYQDGATSREKQVAILRALSAYNTGSSTAGLTTYVPSVLASARKVIPSFAILGLVHDVDAHEHASQQQLRGDAAPSPVLIRPASGTRELVFSAN